MQVEAREGEGGHDQDSRRPTEQAVAAVAARRGEAVQLPQGQERAGGDQHLVQPVKPGLDDEPENGKEDGRGQDALHAVAPGVLTGAAGP